MGSSRPDDRPPGHAPCRAASGIGCRPWRRTNGSLEALFIGPLRPFPVTSRRHVHDDRVDRPGPALSVALGEEALGIEREDVEANRRMGRLGSELVKDGCRVLTHCNAGALATAGYGTALGVLRAAVEAGKRISVFADETRP